MSDNDEHSEYGGGDNHSEFLPDGRRRIPTSASERAEAIRRFALRGTPPPNGMRDSLQIKK